MKMPTAVIRQWLLKRAGIFYYTEKLRKNSSKSIDFSHNKALILSEEFLKDEEKLQKFLEYAKTQELMARNTYLFVTDLKMEHLFGLDQNLEKPLGTYLEELLESDEDYKDKRIMTLGRLYDERSRIRWKHCIFRFWEKKIKSRR